MIIYAEDIKKIMREINMKLRVNLNRKELDDLQYPIVVEMWEKKEFGRIKRAFVKEFPTPAERRKAANLYKMFYRWYLIDGTPDNHTFKPETIVFVERLSNFFGTV